ncbi:hypothetical protein ACHAWF_001032 [Thalassiosira exigua]
MQGMLDGYQGKKESTSSGLGDGKQSFVEDGDKAFEEPICRRTTPTPRGATTWRSSATCSNSPVGAESTSRSTARCTSAEDSTGGTTRRGSTRSAGRHVESVALSGDVRGTGLPPGRGGGHARRTVRGGLRRHTQRISCARSLINPEPVIPVQPLAAEAAN